MGSTARILLSALTLKESVVQRVVPMQVRRSPYQRDRLSARRRKLEESDSNAVGLWGQERSSSSEMGKEYASESRERVSSGRLRQGYLVSRADFLCLVPHLFISLLFSPWVSRNTKGEPREGFYFPCLEL